MGPPSRPHRIPGHSVNNEQRSYHHCSNCMPLRLERASQVQEQHIKSSWKKQHIIFCSHVSQSLLMYTNTRLGAYLHPVKLASVSIENISISEKTKNKSSSICEAVLWFHTKFEVPNQSHLGDAKMTNLVHICTQVVRYVRPFIVMFVSPKWD